jgi:hypothetical protein
MYCAFRIPDSWRAGLTTGGHERLELDLQELKGNNFLFI